MRLEKNHWFVMGDTLSISLWNYHASIVPTVALDEGYLSFTVEITNSSMDKYRINCDNLEEAIYYVENIVSPCLDDETLIKETYEHFNQQEKPLTLIKKKNM